MKILPTLLISLLLHACKKGGDNSPGKSLRTYYRLIPLQNNLLFLWK